MNLTAQQLPQDSERIYRRNNYKLLLYKHQLSTLFELLQENNLNFLILKGWSFLGDLYPDPSRRSFGDVDILIHTENYQAVTSLLKDIGYLVRAGSKPAHMGSKPAYIPLEGTWTHASGVNIDLHTHILTLAWWHPSFPIDLDHIWKTAVQYHDITGLTCMRLSPEVTFLHLCLHIFNHGIFDTHIKSYCDLVILLRKYSHTMQWNQIIQQASEWGMTKIVYWVAQILQRDFQVPLPVEFHPKSRKLSLRFRFIQSTFNKSKSNPSPITTTWLSPFLLRLALIDNPTTFPKLLFTSLLPSSNLRTAIHNKPTSLLQHWQTYTNRILHSLHIKPQNQSITEDKFRL